MISDKFKSRIKKGMWWERAWSLVEGCSFVSLGCLHCWSASAAHMRAHNPNPKIRERYEGLTNPDGRWNGKIRLLEDNITLPYETRKPTVWSIWNDLFHEKVPDRFIDLAFSIMAIMREHKFIILTKRHERLLKYFSVPPEDLWGDRWARNEFGEEPTVFPLRNVIIGITAENQEWWDIRKDSLFSIPAAHKMISLEPLLGSIYFTPDDLAQIDQVIVGGETGPRSRPMHPYWPLKVRNDCEVAGVPFFFKHWGEWGIAEGGVGDDPDPFGRTAMAYRNGKIEVDWEPGPRCEGAISMARIGKERAGRLLDGVEHNNLIWVAA